MVWNTCQRKIRTLKRIKKRKNTGKNTRGMWDTEKMYSIPVTAVPGGT